VGDFRAHALTQAIGKRANVMTRTPAGHDRRVREAHGIVGYAPI
jgi:hypothetical protein